MQFIVENVESGVVFGVYGGRTESEALRAFAQAAGVATVDPAILATPIEPRPAWYWVQLAHLPVDEMARLNRLLAEPVDPINGPWAVVVDTDEGTASLGLAAEQDADPDMILMQGLPTDAVADEWLQAVARATGLPPISMVRAG